MELTPHIQGINVSLRQRLVDATAVKRIEWFSFECRKTKTKVITQANHKEHKQYSEPIKIRSNYM